MRDYEGLIFSAFLCVLRASARLFSCAFRVYPCVLCGFIFLNTKTQRLHKGNHEIDYTPRLPVSHHPLFLQSTNYELKNTHSSRRLNFRQLTMRKKLVIPSSTSVSRQMEEKLSPFIIT